ncbi:MAG: glycosyltransferase family 39 protein [Euryarchaeota archaeon]|nr:glycosyltransferase family 39 protein [Euryarchaeota archaeon]
MNRRWLLLLGILLAGLSLRLWVSDFAPMELDYDHFYHARIGRHIYEGGHLPAWDDKELGGIPYYYPPGYHIWIALGKALLPGQDYIQVGSILTAIFGVLSILALYILARREIGRNGALVASLLFATLPIAVIRTGLWARPTGLAILLAILAVHALLRSWEDRSWAPAALILGAFVLSHSSVLFLVSLGLLGAALGRGERYRRRLLALSTAAILLGLLYYARYIPYLNFSLGYTKEHEPAISIGAYLASGLDPAFLLPEFFFLSYLALTSLPLILYGLLLFLREGRRELAGMVGATILLAFFRYNLLIIYDFLLLLALGKALVAISGVSIGAKRIRFGWSLSALLFLSILSFNLFLVSAFHGERGPLEKYEAVRTVLERADLGPGDLVLSNEIVAGHGIAYYSRAASYLSDLTDVRRWDEHIAVYKVLMEEADEKRALKTLEREGIDYLLIIEPNRRGNFPFLNSTDLPIVLVRGEGGYTAALYRLP